MPDLRLELAQERQPAERYFAIIVKIPESISFANASTTVGNTFRLGMIGHLPEGAKITRSIEITKDLATRAW